MLLNDLLVKHGYDPERVLIFRHLPREPKLRKLLPWLAAEMPAHFNAYQQTQAPREQKALEQEIGRGYVASFIGHEARKAIFVGLYSVSSARPLTFQEFWQMPEHQLMAEFGMWGWKEDEADRAPVLWFELELVDFYPHWKGRLIIDWPGGGRSWYRRAHKEGYRVHAVLETSILSLPMPR